MSAPGTPVETVRYISRDDLDEDYLKYLAEKIPMIFLNGIFDLILEYCNLMNNKRTTKSRKDINEILQQINNCLKEVYRLTNNNLIQIHINKMYNRRFSDLFAEIDKDNTNTSRLLKKQQFSAFTLFEAFLSVTFDFYQKLDKRTNYSVPELQNKTFKMSMKNLKSNRRSKTLKEYIEELYRTTSVNHNEILFNVLKEIAKELDYQQRLCGLIHGDFHYENIIITIDDEGNIIIRFIDFGLSAMRLGTKLSVEIARKVNELSNVSMEELNLVTSKNLVILEAPIEIHIERKSSLNLAYDKYLKSIDLAHLLYNLSDVSFEAEYYYRFKEFTEKLYLKANISVRKAIYNFTRNNSNVRNVRNVRKRSLSSKKNRLLNINDTSILYPLNFMALIFENIGQNKVGKKSKGLFFNNNNNNI